MATEARRLSISKATYVRGASLNSPQKSLRTIIIVAISSASFVRNREAQTRVMFQEELRRVCPRTQEREEKGSSRSKRFLESLDSRLREIEGSNAAWLIPAEAQALVAAVEQAANHYQSQNPGKGKPHPMCPRRVTLAAGLLNALSVINLAKVNQQQQIIIERQDKLLAMVNKPSIARQKEMLGQMLKMYTTPEHLLTEIAACVWFKAKKSEKYLLSLAIYTWSPLHQTWDYILTALLYAGAKLLDGPPPRGPQVRALLWAPTGPCGP